MSLSFPPSAFVGQTYGGFTWDGVKWTATPYSSLPAKIALEVQLTADQLATAATYNTVKYDTVITDLQNGYSPATGIFTPKQAGVYSVSVTVGQIGSAAPALYGLQIIKNGSATGTEAQTVTQYNPTAGNFLQAVSALIYCNGTTDTIQARAFVPTGVTTIRGSTVMGVAVNMVATLLMTGPQGPPGVAASGNKVLLATAIVTTPVASVDFFTPTAFDGTTYDELEIHYFDLLPSATGDRLLWMRCSADGSTFDATGPYWYIFSAGNWNSTTAVASAGGSFTSATGISANYAQNNSNAGWGQYGIMECRVTTTPQFVCMVRSFNLLGASIVSAFGGGAYKINTAVKGLRFYFDTGNISRGTFKLYGIVK